MHHLGPALFAHITGGLHIDYADKHVAVLVSVCLSVSFGLTAILLYSAACSFPPALL